MADGKKFDIELGTKADTSGLEAVERQLKAVAAAGKEAVNPMTDGSQLRAGGAGDAAEQVRKTTEAIQEQTEALEDLTDAEGGVVDATVRLNEEAKKPDGFKSLFDQQRLQQTAREMRQLGATVRDLFQEFAATEAGKEIFGGMSDDARAFGRVALQTGAAVAQGWAAGGPIGAAVAGLNVLVKEVGDSFLAVSRAQQEAARSYAAEEARIIAQTRERRALAADRQIEDRFRSETQWLENQNDQLQNNNRLLDARRGRMSAEFALRQEQDRAMGKSEGEIAIERINAERIAEQRELDRREFMARQQALGAENARDTQFRRTMGIGETKGTGSPEYREARQEWKDLDNETKQARARAAKEEAAIAEERLALQARTAQRLQEEARRQAEESARDSERRARDQAVAEERVSREAKEEAVRRQGLGREGEGIADGVARGAADPRQALALEQIGNRIAADPAGDGLGKLTEAIESLMTTADDARARQLRQALERIERLEARLTKRADNGS